MVSEYVLPWIVSLEKGQIPPEELGFDLEHEFVVMSNNDMITKLMIDFFILIIFFL
jgi:hypothetical protein